jgi:acyl carrier protein
MITKSEMLERIQNIFRDVFDDDNLEVTNKTNSEEIEEWDSLNHINLVVSIEKEFDIQFVLDELQPLKDVGEMLDLLQYKIYGNQITDS